MAFIYEVNGQRVEFDREPTEADIDEAARQLGAPAPVADSPGLQTTAEPTAGELAASAASPAVTAAGMQPLGVSAADIGKVARPILETAKETYRGPMGVVRGVTDATLMAHGVPPLAGAYGAAETMTKRAQALGSAAGEISKGLSNTPGNAPNYFAMGRAEEAAAAKLKDLYHNGGGPNAIKAWLQTPEGAQYMDNPAFRQAAESYMGKVPSLLSQAGKIAAPVAKGAARVLGPVGLAADVYQAGQLARETQLGPRLAAGQGQRAEQALRQGLGMTYQGPQLSPAEAQNVLQSGSPRDVQFFGGRDALSEMIRRKAAEKVLGPRAPGSF
jgi:hypothetical protein